MLLLQVLELVLQQLVFVLALSKSVHVFAFLFIGHCHKLNLILEFVVKHLEPHSSVVALELQLADLRLQVLDLVNVDLLVPGQDFVSTVEVADGGLVLLELLNVNHVLLAHEAQTLLQVIPLELVEDVAYIILSSGSALIRSQQQLIFLLQLPPEVVVVLVNYLNFAFHRPQVFD